MVRLLKQSRGVNIAVTVLGGYEKQFMVDAFYVVDGAGEAPGRRKVVHALLTNVPVPLVSGNMH